jgi:hypothetical protein
LPEIFAAKSLAQLFSWDLAALAEYFSSLRSGTGPCHAGALCETLSIRLPGAPARFALQRRSGRTGEQFIVPATLCGGSDPGPEP